MRLLIRNAAQVVQVCSNKELFLTGKAMGELAIIDKPTSIAVDQCGKITMLGTDSDVMAAYSEAEFDKVIDATGKCVLPGFIDGHTHPVWAGDRVHEFSMKLSGATYMEVHAAGGGINFTVNHTRAASEEDLLESLLERLESMLVSGTTTAECKSGYGLNTETEMKMLRVIEKAKLKQSVEISSTYCGAHAIPKGSTAESATDDVISHQIPALAAAAELNVENIDVFCEKGVFNAEQTKRILQAGLGAGLHINFHGDELSYTGSAELASELRISAISHLEEVSDGGMAAMAEAKTAAVLLPTTAYILRLNPPPARKLIAAGVPVALGSDFNPNAYCHSMPMVMHLACVLLHMSLKEALCAATINSAFSINRSQTHGSIEVGKYADLIIVNSPNWEHIIYRFGEHINMINSVIKAGNIVHTN